MNSEKYEEIKNRYCVNVTDVNFSALDNTNEMNMVVGESLTYNYNNGVVTFVDEMGMSYVSPFYEIIETLEQAGYKQGGLYIPFTNNNWLNKGASSQKWQNLLAENRRNQMDNIDISDNFNIEENLEQNIQL